MPIAAPPPLYTQYYPRTYVAPYLAAAPLSMTIDGNLSKLEWQQAPWSNLFDDIRGVDDSPTDERPPSTCTTRIKMMWDDKYLYIGALLEADADHPVVTSFRNRNDPIFQQDSDFEVFIDPFVTNHDYKEFEVNAYNTIWNLMLDEPYDDGGVEHSGRIANPGDEFYYDVLHQTSAVQLLEGSLNNCSNETTKWSVEIRMAYSDLLTSSSSSSKTGGAGTAPPSKGSRWRINFSRVERKGDINWTWQPQIEWNPHTKRYEGKVNMHLPNAWGYLVFGDGDAQDVPQDPEWPIRMAAMTIYAAQHAHYDERQTYASQISELHKWLDTDLIESVVSHVKLHVPLHNTFRATLSDKNYEATIRQDRYLQVTKYWNENTTTTDSTTTTTTATK